MLKVSKRSVLVGLFVLALAMAGLGFAGSGDSESPGGGYWQELALTFTPLLP